MTTRSFLIFPAIDLKGGKVVRLQQGRADAATVYSDDPGAVAKRWE
jgi:phosphoribosylformimino-5-aminoimidazole carboxamide ribotide isomerase